jgi:hypothetical protein
MKSREEIEQLANDYWEGCDGCDANDKYFFIKGFVCAYIQLQEGIGDKKYTEKDMLKCWNYLMAAMTSKNPVFFKDYINSLNKQD